MRPQWLQTVAQMVLHAYVSAVVFVRGCDLRVILPEIRGVVYTHVPGMSYRRSGWVSKVVPNVPRACSIYTVYLVGVTVFCWYCTGAGFVRFSYSLARLMLGARLVCF